MFGVTLLHILIDVQSNSIEANFDRKPGENTLLYLPFNGNSNDESGHYTITNNSVSIGDKVASFLGTSSSYLISTSNFGLSGNPNATINIFLKHTRQGTEIVVGCGAYTTGNMFGFYIDSSNKIVLWNYAQDITTSATVDLNSRNMITMTTDGSQTKIYKNANLVSTTNTSYNIVAGLLCIGKNQLFSSYNYKGDMGITIIEKKTRTQEEITKYFNQMKNKYGIS